MIQGLEISRKSKTLGIEHPTYLAQREAKTSAVEVPVQPSAQAATIT